MRGPAERLLAREYWKGQMHGGSEHPVHARHMRPRCSSVPSGQNSPPNFKALTDLYVVAARATSSIPGSPIESRRTSTAEPMSESLLPNTQKTCSKAYQNFALFVCCYQADHRSGLNANLYSRCHISTGKQTQGVLKWRKSWQRLPHKRKARTV